MESVESRPVPGRRSKAFIAENTPRFTTNDVERFGERVYLTRHRQVSPTHIDTAVREIARGLVEHGYDPERDYLVHTGPSVLVTVMVTLAARICGRAKLLIFSTGIDKYVVRVMDLQEAADMLVHEKQGTRPDKEPTS